MKIVKERLHGVHTEVYIRAIHTEVYIRAIHHVTFSIYVVQFSMFHNKNLTYGNCTNIVVILGGGVKNDKIFEKYEFI